MTSAFRPMAYITRCELRVATPSTCHVLGVLITPDMSLTGSDSVDVVCVQYFFQLRLYAKFDASSLMTLFVTNRIDSITTRCCTKDVDRQVAESHIWMQ